MYESSTCSPVLSTPLPKRARLAINQPPQTDDDSAVPVSLAEDDCAINHESRSDADDSSLAAFGNISRRYCDVLDRSSRVSNADALSSPCISDSLHNTVYLQQHPSSQYGSGGSGGSEGESAAHTPCSYVSSGSSTYGALPLGQPGSQALAADSGVRRVNHNVSALHRFQDDISQPVSCDLNESLNTAGNDSECIQYQILVCILVFIC